LAQLSEVLGRIQCLLAVSKNHQGTVALISGKTYHYLRVVEMPVVQVSVWAGMSKENKQKLVEGMTRVLEELGIPREAVTIIIYEAPKTNWASGGQLHSEKYANR
jgi:4-oxalocrotonate tautomerase